MCISPYGFTRLWRQKRGKRKLLGDSTESGLAALRGPDEDGVVIAAGAVIAEEPSGAVLVMKQKGTVRGRQTVRPLTVGIRGDARKEESNKCPRK